MESAKRINEKKTITETGGIKGIIDEAKALLWTWFGWFLVNFRWVIVVPVVLPLSFLFEQFWRIRNYWVQDRAPHLHDQRVKQIQEQILKWREGGCKGKLCTARKNWLNTSTKFAKYKATANQIHIDLYDILELNTEKKTVKVEPLVNMGQLTNFLVPKGWTLPVVPELDDLTISGLILGYGIEASSHKYGLFSDIVQSMEIVTGDGKLVRCSRTENKDLFYGLPWSYGSLGFLVSIELSIIPVKKYVHIHYTPFYNHRACLDFFEKEITKENPVEFIDLIFYSKDRAVAVHGDMVDEPLDKSKNINEIGWWYKPWFYKYVQSFLEKGKHDEYVPIRQYYHRYTRSLYWNGSLMVPFGNNVIFRYVLGWLMPPRVPFLKLTGGPLMRKQTQERFFIQDGLVPLEHMRECFEFLHDTVEVYPLWVVGHKLFNTDPKGFIHPKDTAKDYEMYVDLGAWFVPKKKGYNAQRDTRKFEQFLREHRGYQCLYAQIYQTRDEYEQMFNTTLYKQLRTKYHAEGFVDVYDKVQYTPL